MTLATSTLPCELLSSADTRCSAAVTSSMNSPNLLDSNRRACTLLETVGVLAKCAPRVIREGSRTAFWTCRPFASLAPERGIDGPDLARGHREQLHPGRTFERECE